jgi:hypothetical protein
MPEAREHWMTRLASKLSAVAVSVVFVGVELTLFLIIAWRSKLPLERSSVNFFLLPVIALLPMAAGVQAYRRVKQHLLNNTVDSERLLRFIRSLLITLVTIAYATILIILGTLLSVIRVSR